MQARDLRQLRGLLVVQVPEAAGKPVPSRGGQTAGAPHRWLSLRRCGTPALDLASRFEQAQLPDDIHFRHQQTALRKDDDEVLARQALDSAAGVRRLRGRVGGI